MIKTIDAKSIDNIIKATNSQTKIPAVWLHATEEIHRKIEALLLGADLYYDRRKNFHRNRGITPSRIVTIPYLAQALAAIVLQRPDDARARPTTVAEKYYKQLFSDECPGGIYVKSAQILKRIDSFLDGQDLTTADRSNMSFYLAMYAVCAVLKSPHPRKQTFAAIDIDKITDTALTESLRLVSGIYTRMGGDDRAAKGTFMLDKIKKNLRSRFGRSQVNPSESLIR